MRAERPTHGDGHTPTTSLEPAKCPCGGHLVIACAKGCGEEHPELGLTGAMDPIARLRAPKTDEQPRQRATTTHTRPIASVPLRARIGGTRDLLLAAIGAEPAKAMALAVRLGMNAHAATVSMMLTKLTREGVIERHLPLGLTRGATYHLVQKSGGGGGQSYDAPDIPMRRAA